MQYPDLMVARVLRGRYDRMSLPLRTIHVNNPSYVWTNISAVWKLIVLGIRHKVHSGYEVEVWEDPWISTTPSSGSTLGPSSTSKYESQWSHQSWIKGMGWSATQGLCSPGRYTLHKEYDHKHNSPAGYILLELHQKWIVYSKIRIFSSPEQPGGWCREGETGT